MADSSLTKLISVSLGKIHQTQKDKHGQNLRRSLLVASVLSQARVEYIAEIKLHKIRSELEEREAQLNNNNNNTSISPSNTSSPRKRKLVSQRSTSEMETQSQSNTLFKQPKSLDQHCDSTTSNHDSELYSPTTISDLVLNEIQTVSESDKENSSPQSDKSFQLLTKPPSAKRCFKRSLSVTEEFTTHKSEEGGSTDAKRGRPETTSDIATLTHKLSNSFMEFTTTATSDNIAPSQCGVAMADFNCFAVKYQTLDSSVILEA